jgi:sigma-B regulation protein RsbU (phosphoserine phosphatase)
VFVILVSAFCFAKAFSWINKPFAGFLVYDEPYVGTYSSRDWPGPQAGLRTLDRVVSVNGEPVVGGRDLVNAVAQKKPGTQVHLVVESKGTIRQVILPVITFSVKDFFLICVTTFLGGLILYALGFIVYMLKPNMSSTWVFLLLCLTIGIYMITGFDILTSYNLVYLHYGFLSLFPVLFIHLALIFPERKRILNQHPALEYLIYFPGFALCIAYQVYFITFPENANPAFSSWVPTYKTLSYVSRFFSPIAVLILVGSLVHALVKASSAQARQRAKMILSGVCVAFVTPALGQGFAFFTKVHISWNLFVFVILFFPASIAYSIAKHNLFDADAIIQRTVGYVVVTIALVGAYLGVSLGLNVLIGEYEVARSRAFPILFSLGVILVFNPVRNRVQALVDRVFFRKDYDYGEIVEKVGGATTSLLELQLILRRLIQTFMEDMFVNTSSVMLLAPAGTEFQVFLADGDQKQIVEKVALKQDNPLMEIIRREKRELTKYDVLEDPRYKAVSESCAADFSRLNASLIVPLVYQNQVIGSLNLGEKKSGKAYNREDIELLRTIASQGSVAIENARLFQENLEKQRMEEELNIARNLQMSMLPASCPKIKGFEISASSTPAREVGGDFYDFIEMGKDRLGLVVGDVTGKSVSGALVMAASRSVFRMLSEEQLTVGDIMIRANWRTKKDIKKGMFVALLYSVLDGKTKTLTLCSAGQTQPVCYSAATGKASLLHTVGDTFPLGILDEVDYQETKLELASGDKVVFYTDGIVEAMNVKQEIFGFERLLEVVQGATPSLNADSLLQEILDRVSTFSSGAQQHDDLTLIVVSVP